MDRKLLSEYKLAIVVTNDAEYLDWANRGWFVTIDGVEQTNARNLAGQIGLAKAMRKYDLHRGVSFHNRVLRPRTSPRSSPRAAIDLPPRRARIVKRRSPFLPFARQPTLDELRVLGCRPSARSNVRVLQSRRVGPLYRDLGDAVCLSLSP